MQGHKAIENPEDVCFNCLKETEVNKIHIRAMGYGSGFDNFSTRINLCDECMKLTNKEWWKLEKVQCDWDTTESEDDYDKFHEYKYENEIFAFIKQMPLAGQELFMSRFSYGACADDYMVGQDWIDYRLGILPHEKCKEYGYHSPQEINAYKERFPICQYPVNKIYDDGSKGCWCPFGENGNYGQELGLNISDKCFECKYYVIRQTPIRDILDEDWNDYKIYIKAKMNMDKYIKKFE